MKCNKSYKRSMLVLWGLHELERGRSHGDVYKDISRWMRKTIPEVQEMVLAAAKERKALKA